MKHFEELWEEAEQLQKDSMTLDSRLDSIRNLIEGWQKEHGYGQLTSIELENLQDLIGIILFELAGLSKDMKINVAAILNKRIEEEKIDLYN
jgi:hypothetical protein